MPKKNTSGGKKATRRREREEEKVADKVYVARRKAVWKSHSLPKVSITSQTVSKKTLNIQEVNIVVYVTCLASESRTPPTLHLYSSVHLSHMKR